MIGDIIAHIFEDCYDFAGNLRDPRCQETGDLYNKDIFEEKRNQITSTE